MERIGIYRIEPESARERSEEDINNLLSVGWNVMKTDLEGATMVVVFEKDEDYDEDIDDEY